MARRPYGTGSLTVRRGKWFGQWRAGERLTSRVIGPVRKPGTRDGLTRVQAERELQRLVQSHGPAQVRGITVSEAGERLLEHLEAMGRKRATLADYESVLRVHLVPFFGEKPLDKITRADVERFMASMRRAGAASKTIVNAVGVLHGVLKHAGVRENPAKGVELPAVGRSADIRFLLPEEVDALVRSSSDFEGALYLTAAWTGLRQGELVALRWRDVDWTAGRIRVRQSYVRGEYTSPKSRRGVRSVPLADRVAAELERHSQRSHYQDDDDLVFGHPLIGKPLDRSKLLKRFKAACRRAGVREVRFHDLRHTFGTRMAAAGVPMRTLQEWMGHRDFKTTLIYADYAPDQSREREMVEQAFAPAVINPVIKPSETEENSAHLSRSGMRQAN
jgi:integrase